MLHFIKKCDIITLEKKRGDFMTDRMIFLDTLRESLQKQLDALDVYMNTVAREDYDKMSEEASGKVKFILDKGVICELIE